MTLLQHYIFRQALGPLLVALFGLAGLALLTQSLSTLDLIVKNRQSAGTFFWITILALPQLVSVILPMAVLLASLFSLNRLNSDSELIVARATGVGPWNIASPVVRLAALAAVAHLIINLFVQPAAYRELRENLLKVRTDVASKMIVPGEFNQPVEGLTIYGQDLRTNGTVSNVIIHDERDEDDVLTYVAEEGELVRSPSGAFLVLRRGSIQERIAEDQLDVINFQEHQVDLTGVVAGDTVLRLKKSDRFLHELLNPRGSDLLRADEYAAEAHSRLSAPLYSIAFGLLALVFLARGRHRRLGYGRQILAAAAIGFILRLTGFSIGAAAESNAALNIVQYLVPLGTIAACLALLLARRRIRIEEEPLLATSVPA